MVNDPVTVIMLFTAVFRVLIKDNMTERINVFNLNQQRGRVATRFVE